MPLHVSSTMCLSSGGQNCIIQHLVSPVGCRPMHGTTTYRCDDSWLIAMIVLDGVNTLQNSLFQLGMMAGYALNVR